MRNPSLEKEVEELTKEEEIRLRWPQNILEVIVSYLSPLEVISEIPLARLALSIELHPAKDPVYAVSADCRFLVLDSLNRRWLHIIDTRSNKVIDRFDYESKDWEPVALAIHDSDLYAVAVKHDKRRFAVIICEGKKSKKWTMVKAVDNQPMLYFVASKVKVAAGQDECRFRVKLQLQIVTPHMTHVRKRSAKKGWQRTTKALPLQALLKPARDSSWKERVGSQCFKHSVMVAGEKTFVLRIGFAGGDVCVVDKKQQLKPIVKTAGRVLAIGYHAPLGILSIMHENGILSVVYDINSNLATHTSRKLPLGAHVPCAAFFSHDGRTLVVILPHSFKLFDIFPSYLVAAGFIPTGMVTEMVSLNILSGHTPIAFDSLNTSWISHGNVVFQNTLTGDFVSNIDVSKSHSLQQPLAHNPAKKQILFTISTNRGIYLLDYSTNPPSKPRCICVIDSSVDSPPLSTSRSSSTLLGRFSLSPRPLLFENGDSSPRSSPFIESACPPASSPKRSPILSPTSSPSFFALPTPATVLPSLGVLSSSTPVPPPEDSSSVDRFEKKGVHSIRRTGSNGLDKPSPSHTPSPRKPTGHPISVSTRGNHGEGHGEPKNKQPRECVRVLDIDPTGEHLLAIIEVRGRPSFRELRLWHSRSENLLLRTTIRGKHAMSDKWLAYVEDPSKIRIVSLESPKQALHYVTLEYPVLSLSFVQNQSDSSPALLIVDYERCAWSFNFNSRALLPLSDEIYQDAVLHGDGHLLAFNPLHRNLSVLSPHAMKNLHEKSGYTAEYMLDVVCRSFSFPSPNILCCHTIDNNVVRYLVKTAPSSPSPTLSPSTQPRSLEKPVLDE